MGKGNMLFSPKNSLLRAAKQAKPVTSSTGVFSGSKFLRIRKPTIKGPEKILREASRVGRFDPGKPLPGMEVTAAAREYIPSYKRRGKGGKTITVRAHTRRGEPTRVSVKKETPEQKQARDLELWLAWKKGGQKPSDLKPLLKRFKGMIQSRANVYKRTPIPPAAIDAEFKKQFIRALRAYNPEKGKLGTFVYRYLDAAKRFIANYQNPARIPETRIYKIGEFNTAQQHLDDLLGRRPTDKELSDYLKWPLKEVQRLSTELRRGLIRTEFGEFDPSTANVTRRQQVLDLIRYELTPREKEVYDHLFGTGGREVVQSTTEIAKRTKMSIFQVSRIKKSITEKVKRYLK